MGGELLWIWMIFIGAYFAFQGAKPAAGFFQSNIELNPSKYKYRELGNREEWRLKKFHRDDYRKLVVLDCHWLQHDMNLLWHRITIEECPFCPIHEKEKAQKKIDRDSMTVRADFGSQSGDVKPKDIRDWETLLYCKESPRMTLEEGESIVEMNASGDICVQYQTFTVKCMDCGNTKPHKHTNKELLESQKALEKVQTELNDFNQALLSSMEGAIVPMILPEGQEKPVIQWPAPPPSHY